MFEITDRVKVIKVAKLIDVLVVLSGVSDIFGGLAD